MINVKTSINTLRNEIKWARVMGSASEEEGRYYPIISTEIMPGTPVIISRCEWKKDIPDPPSINENYQLLCTVNNSIITYSWVAITT